MRNHDETSAVPASSMLMVRPNEMQMTVVHTGTAITGPRHRPARAMRHRVDDASVPRRDQKATPAPQAAKVPTIGQNQTLPHADADMSSPGTDPASKPPNVRFVVFLIGYRNTRRADATAINEPR